MSNKKGVADGESVHFIFPWCFLVYLQAEANLFRSWYTKQNISWIVRCKTQHRTKTLITWQCMKALSLKVQMSPFHSVAAHSKLRLRHDERFWIIILIFNFTLFRYFMYRIHLTYFSFLHINQITYGWKGCPV